jgi:hypothetical protein
VRPGRQTPVEAAPELLPLRGFVGRSEEEGKRVSPDIDSLIFQSSFPWFDCSPFWKLIAAVRQPSPCSHLL